MNRIIGFENSYVEIDDNSIDLFSDLNDIGFQIKTELGLRYSPIQFISARKFYIGNIVGNITLNKTNLVIYPKYVGNESKVPTELEMKKLFSRTLKCAGKNFQSTVFFYKNNIINEQNDFFDTLAKYYLDITRQAIKKSKICLYEEKIEKVTTIKGRILVQKQLSELNTDAKTWCKYRKLTDNNLYNQLLGWCCKYLSGITSNFEFKRNLLVLSREFPQQIDLLNVYEVKKIKGLRQFSEYDESLFLARNLYLDNCSKKEKMGKGNRVCGYAINMERSFENIIGFYSRMAAYTYGFMHKTQVTKRLATSIKGEDYSYDIRPDDLISKENRILIIDAKYKIVSTKDKYRKKPSRDDFYQMVSSCIAYNCHEAVLIYPQTVDFPQTSWCTDNAVNGFNIIVKAEAINLGFDDEKLIAQLTEIIKHTDFFEEVTNE